MVKPIYNRILFTIEKTPGDIRGTRPIRKITQGTYPEGYFMPKDYGKTENFSIKNLAKTFIKIFKDIKMIIKGEVD